MSDSQLDFTCCICGHSVAKNDPDGYSLQIRKFAAATLKMVWAHGPCLRRVITVIGVKIPEGRSDM